MNQKLKVSFDDPEHGWVCLNINCGDTSATIIASYTPSDSFLGLTNALYDLLHYEGEATVVWHEEPAETELRFFRTKDLVRLEVWFFFDDRRDYGRAKKEFEVSGLYEEICLPFWRALRSLQGRFSNEELGTRWHRAFPWKEIDLLTKAIKGKSF